MPRRIRYRDRDVRLTSERPGDTWHSGHSYPDVVVDRREIACWRRRTVRVQLLRRPAVRLNAYETEVRQDPRFATRWRGLPRDLPKLSGRWVAAPRGWNQNPRINARDGLWYGIVLEGVGDWPQRYEVVQTILSGYTTVETTREPPT